MKGATCTLDTEVDTRTLENKFSATREECTELGNTIEKQGGSNRTSTNKTVGTRTVFRDQSDTLGAKARCGFESHPTDKLI